MVNLNNLNFCVSLQEEEVSWDSTQQSRTEESLMWEAKLQEMMTTMRKSKRRLEGNYQELGSTGE